MGIVRKFINANIVLSRLLDRIFPARIREDGNKFFLSEYLPTALRPGIVVYDLGGGSRPCISREEKNRLDITLVGVDISATELIGAPEGVYDRTITTDLSTFIGTGDADSVICQALLEHVPDTFGAMRELATTAKPRGHVFLFAPSRNALFARLNLLLPEGLKRWILFAVFPSKAQGHDGFKAYYDHCTPRQIEELARQNGLEVEERRLFWTSSYFMVFTPAFILWRLWQLASYIIIGNNAAETFAYVLYKKPDAEYDE